MTQFQHKLVKYPKIFGLGSPENEGIMTKKITITSKIDGANARFLYDAETDSMQCGSRNNLLLPNTNENQWKFMKSVNIAFKEYKSNLIPGHVYFVESMQKHTLQYDNIPDAIGLDILNLDSMEFLHWSKSKSMFENIGIDFVYVHNECNGDEVTIDELMELIKHSIYRKSGGDEGLVLKAYGEKNKYNRDLFAKIVTDSFKEQNKAAFGESGQPKKQSKDNEIKIADTYLTPARFVKALQHFEDENEPIGMSLMPKLYKYLMNDILSEYIISISNDYNSINFPALTKIIAGRCAMQLKSYLLTKATS